MLSLESTYPPTYQLALDMLKVQLILILLTTYYMALSHKDWELPDS